MKIGGLPATVDYRKPAGDKRRRGAHPGDARRCGPRAARPRHGRRAVRPGAVQADSAACFADDRESRYQIEADLRDSKISELLPGWWKAAGKATKVSFTAIDKPQIMRFDDIVIEGPGTLVKGMIELDANGEIVLASFPTFALSDGDKATLRADRAPDGTLKVTMRGELFDGRGFIKSATSGSTGDKGKPQSRDFDLDVKLGTVTGYNVEALRGVELRLSRRNGHVRTFGMIAKLGSNASLMGDLRAYPGGRRVIYLELNDAGALLRFTDIYSRVVGGQMWAAMDPPTADQRPQEGVHQRARLLDPRRSRRWSASPPTTAIRTARTGTVVRRRRHLLAHARGVHPLARQARVRDGVVWGPAMGATIEGKFDYRATMSACAAPSCRPMR